MNSVFYLTAGTEAGLDVARTSASTLSLPAFATYMPTATEGADALPRFTTFAANAVDVSPDGRPRFSTYGSAADLAAAHTSGATMPAFETYYVDGGPASGSAAAGVTLSLNAVDPTRAVTDRR